MSLFSGLGSLGLGKLENADLFEKPQEEDVKEKKSEEPVVKSYCDSDFLLDKAITCPVCQYGFKYRTMKTGKARLISQEDDLRPRFVGIDPIKYDVIVCPKCGYSAINRYFNITSAVAIKLVKENIAGKVRGVTNKPEFTYDEAIDRFRLALASSVVKKAQDSEKAYTCLRMGWCIRGKAESLPLDLPDYDEQIAALRADEKEALEAALNGFVSARAKETFPIAGMDEPTLDYIIAALATKFDQLDIASRMVATVLTNSASNNRIKDRARDLKEILLEKKKMNS